MEIISQIGRLPPQFAGAVTALGNFDGVHRGHQAVLGRARALAREMQKPFAVMTFEPHPRSLFFPEHKPFRITPPAIKRRLLAGMGVDVLFEIPFTRDFSQKTADDFVAGLLVQQCAIGHAVAGHDFVFGHKRGGDIAFLHDRLAAHGIGVTEITPQTDGAAQLWSSTRVRAHIEKGEMRAASIILGRAWEIEGPVLKSEGRGTALGFPTANMDMDGYIRPRFGVYAVRAKIGDKSYNGVANAGIRPTVGGGQEKLEVHLFDFSGDLYGTALSVSFVDFIREERRFPSLDALKEQISKDCLEARSILA